MAKTPVTKIKVGDCIGTPGDRKVRTVWGRVTKIRRPYPDMFSLCSPDWASESSKKYGDGLGCYSGLRGESLPVSPTKCKV